MINNICIIYLYISRIHTLIIYLYKGHNYDRWSFKMISAALCAIIMVGAAVLPDVIIGITEASATLSPVTPRTLNRVSTTADASPAVPIRQVPTGWNIVVPISPAALINSSSLWYCTPGRYSTGVYWCSVREVVIRSLVSRIALAATRWSLGWER